MKCDIFNLCRSASGALDRRVRCPRHPADLIACIMQYFMREVLPAGVNPSSRKDGLNTVSFFAHGTNNGRGEANLVGVESTACLAPQASRRRVARSVTHQRNLLFGWEHRLLRGIIEVDLVISFCMAEAVCLPGRPCDQAVDGNIPFGPETRIHA